MTTKREATKLEQIERDTLTIARRLREVRTGHTKSPTHTGGSFVDAVETLQGGGCQS